MNPAALAALLTELLGQNGRPVTFSRGGVRTTITCISDHANPTTINTYFDQNNAVGFTYPVQALYFDATCSGTNNPPQNLDSYSLDNRNYSVQICAPFYLGSEIVMYIALAD